MCKGFVGVQGGEGTERGCKGFWGTIRNYWGERIAGGSRGCWGVREENVQEIGVQGVRRVGMCEGFWGADGQRVYGMLGYTRGEASMEHWDA